MATVPTPRTWAVGELLTAAKLNTDLRDGLNLFISPPLAVLTKTSSQSVTTGTLTSVTWPGETIDRDGGHDNVTNNSRYTAQTAGWYDAVFHYGWVANTTGLRNSFLTKNGATFESFRDLRTPEPGSGSAAMLGSGRVFLAVGDYLEVRAIQTSGGALNIDGGYQGNHFSVVWRSIA